MLFKTHSSLHKALKAGRVEVVGSSPNLVRVVEYVKFSARCLIIISVVFLILLLP